jgi:hypothetical protein
MLIISNGPFPLCYLHQGMRSGLRILGPARSICIKELHNYKGLKIEQKLEHNDGIFNSTMMMGLLQT